MGPNRYDKTGPTGRPVGVIDRGHNFHTRYATVEDLSRWIARSSEKSTGTFVLW
jgi:hypothetical protein